MEFIEEFRFNNSKALLNYLNGGKGSVILVAPSGKHHTYKFNKAPSDFPDNMLFVYAVHQDKNFYLGVFEDSTFRTTSHSKFTDDTEIVKGAFYIDKLAHNDSLMECTVMKIYHAGVCGKCGRPIKPSKKSNLGFGKKCLKQVSEYEL